MMRSSAENAAAHENSPQMFAASQQVLAQWLELGVIRALDVALIQFCQQQRLLANSKAATLEVMDHQLTSANGMNDTDPQQDLWLWLALASAQLAQGHLCLDLALALSTPETMLPATGRYGHGMTLLQNFSARQHLSNVLQLLKQAPDLVFDAGNGVQLSGHASMTQPITPFVLAGERLYLRRYWQYEQQIKEFIAKCQQRDLLNRQAADVDTQDHLVLQTTLALLFGSSQQQPDWQRIACAMAATRSFTVITGGPGTGKTTTVVKLLLLLQHVAQNNPLKIQLAAPTGKAAARLTESIASAVQRLSVDAKLAELPWSAVQLTAQTLHRLLGSIPGRQQFKHHAANPLPLDVLVVDEASMVDVELMASLLAALPKHAHLILLGDKDQLASVEAGAILAELCKEARAGGYSEETAKELAMLSQQSIPAEFIAKDAKPLEQHIVMLRTSHRFQANSAIGQLASAVNEGNARQVEQLFTQMTGDELGYLAPTHGRWLKSLVLGDDRQQGLWPFFQLLQQSGIAADTHASLLLKQLGQFQLLCALRQGAFGVEQVNLQIEQLLRQQRLVTRPDAWYAGRPVMISQNDYSTGLMNGDIGICLQVHEQGRDLLKVAFAVPQGIRWFLPSRLPALETVFAMTVHKSQGSEFDHAVLLLPETTSPVLTRELLYTAITRAAKRFTVVATDLQVMYKAVLQPTIRRGGLRL